MHPRECPPLGQLEAGGFALKVSAPVRMSSCLFLVKLPFTMFSLKAVVYVASRNFLETSDLFMRGSVQDSGRIFIV